MLQSAWFRALVKRATPGKIERARALVLVLLLLLGCSVGEAWGPRQCLERLSVGSNQGWGTGLGVRLAVLSRPGTHGPGMPLACLPWMSSLLTWVSCLPWMSSLLTWVSCLLTWVSCLLTRVSCLLAWMPRLLTWVLSTLPWWSWCSVWVSGVWACLQ